MIDDIDRQIIHTLQQNGKIKNIQLAKHLNLSAPACLERVKNLEKNGVIQQYTVLLDYDQIGYSVQALVWISLDSKHRPDISRIKKQLACIKEISECYQITGTNGFVLKVHVKNMKEYAVFVNEKLIGVTGIRMTNSSFVIDTIKNGNTIDP